MARVEGSKTAGEQNSHSRSGHHATNVVEHPRLVADRIMRFAQIVGRENVIASTDCGLGGRIHPQIAWAKLAALADGAKLATRDLWQ
jgi:5-methyltetrahydropteroyltriglutamate--homocysteine methyltransferase